MKLLTVDSRIFQKLDYEIIKQSNVLFIACCMEMFSSTVKNKYVPEGICIELIWLIRGDKRSCFIRVNRPQLRSDHKKGEQGSRVCYKLFNKNIQLH